jgi:hypothetical protein
MPHKHDEAKLPQWAQRELALLRRRVNGMTFIAPRAMNVGGKYILQVDLGPKVNLAAGDALELQRGQVQDMMANTLGMISAD